MGSHRAHRCSRRYRTMVPEAAGDGQQAHHVAEARAQFPSHQDFGQGPIPVCWRRRTAWSALAPGRRRSWSGFIRLRLCTRGPIVQVNSSPRRACDRQAHRHNVCPHHPPSAAAASLLRRTGRRRAGRRPRLRDCRGFGHREHRGDTEITEKGLLRFARFYRDAESLGAAGR